MQIQISNKQLNKQQKLLFLRYIITFGLNFNTIQQLLDTLIYLQKQNNVFQNNQKHSISLKHYLQEFLEVLQNTNRQNNHENCHYFWQIDQDTIINRISNLKCLKYAFEYYKQRLTKYNLSTCFKIATLMNKEKMSQTPIYTHSWKNIDDIQLMRLILKYGYSHWKTICQNFNEQKIFTNLKGYKYLSSIIWSKIKQSPKLNMTIEKVIQIRSLLLISHKSFEKLLLQNQIN